MRRLFESHNVPMILLHPNWIQSNTSKLAAPLDLQGLDESVRPPWRVCLSFPHRRIPCRMSLTVLYSFAIDNPKPFEYLYYHLRRCESLPLTYSVAFRPKVLHVLWSRHPSDARLGRMKMKHKHQTQIYSEPTKTAGRVTVSLTFETWENTCSCKSV